MCAVSQSPLRSDSTGRLLPPASHLRAGAQRRPLEKAGKPTDLALHRRQQVRGRQDRGRGQEDRRRADRQAKRLHPADLRQRGGQAARSHPEESSRGTQDRRQETDSRTTRTAQEISQPQCLGRFAVPLRPEGRQHSQGDRQAGHRPAGHQARADLHPRPDRGQWCGAGDQGLFSGRHQPAPRTGHTVGPLDPGGDHNGSGRTARQRQGHHLNRPSAGLGEATDQRQTSPGHTRDRQPQLDAPLRSRPGSHPR